MDDDSLNPFLAEQNFVDSFDSDVENQETYSKHFISI